MISTIVKLLLRSPGWERYFSKFTKNMKRSYLLTAILSIAIVLTTGCASLRPTRIPEFLHELQRHDFSASERETIAEILHYVNSLENE